MRPPSVARRYTLSPNVAIIIHAPSGIAGAPSQRHTEPRLHQSELRLHLLLLPLPRKAYTTEPRNEDP